MAEFESIFGTKHTVDPLLNKKTTHSAFKTYVTAYYKVISLN